MKYLPYLPTAVALVLLVLASRDPQGADSPEAAPGAMLLG